MFSDDGDWRLNYQQLKLVQQIRDYKKTMDKVDFVDMIEQFVLQVTVRCSTCSSWTRPRTGPAQWRMIHEVMRPCAKRVYFAGDDDQCIFSWMGVDVGTS